jgi:membrane-associated HD superfamily phosphohydrolase
LRLLLDLKSDLQWLDLLVGFAATIFISFVLIGFSFQSIANYGLGQTATDDVRAFEDVVYVDADATALKRVEAEASVPALYQLDKDRILNHEKSISSAFAEARKIIAASSVERKQMKWSSAEEEDLLEQLKNNIKAFFYGIISILIWKGGF